jgi:hypothetical protein
MTDTHEHYTPAHVVERARRCLGGVIDLDPASCAAANATVRATRYYALPRDGLVLEWSGRVFLNPPGGLAHEPHRTAFSARSSACAWWRRLVYELRCRRVMSAVFVGFNIEILRSSQGHTELPGVLAFPFCVPSRRLRFSGDQPTHANVIAYLGPDVGAFVAAFGDIGTVVVP